MLGSLQKKRGIWHIVFDHGRDPVTNRRKQKWISTGTRNKKEAEKKMADMSKEINAGDYIEPSKMTLGEFLETWKKEYLECSIRKSTASMYKCYLDNHTIPGLGHIPLSQLKPLHIQQHVNRVLKKMASSSARREFAILNTALNHAIKWQIITFNPCQAVTPPRIEKHKTKVYNPDQLQILLEAARSDRAYLPILLGAACGMRRGEICGLRWEDTDLKLGLLFIRNSLDWQDSVLTLNSVKTDASERSIKVPPLVLAALKTEKRRQAEEKILAGGLYQDKGFVWAWDDGRPHDPDYLYRAFQKVVKRHNKEVSKNPNLTQKQKDEETLPTIRFHDLRHSHATALLLAGVPVKVISERLGHSSIDITQDIYSHVLPQMQDQAADEIEKMLTKSR